MTGGICYYITMIIICLFFNCFFVSVFFFNEEKLTKKGAGPGEWKILLLYITVTIICLFQLLLCLSSFFYEEKLTKKGAGPGDRGGVALDEHQDTVESRLERRDVFVELRGTEEDMRGGRSENRDAFKHHLVVHVKTSTADSCAHH